MWRRGNRGRVRWAGLGGLSRTRAPRVVRAGTSCPPIHFARDGRNETSWTCADRDEALHLRVGPGDDARAHPSPDRGVHLADRVRAGRDRGDESHVAVAAVVAAAPVDDDRADGRVVACRGALSLRVVEPVAGVPTPGALPVVS